MDNYFALKDSLKELELDCLEEFAALFDGVFNAGCRLSGITDKNFAYEKYVEEEWRSNTIEEYRQRFDNSIDEDHAVISDIAKITEIKTDFNLEITRNFKNFPDLIESYLQYILIRLDACKEFDVNSDINWYRGNYYGVDSSLAEYEASRRVIIALIIDNHVRNSLKKWKKIPNIKRTNAEKYLIACQDILYDFGKTLDLVCINSEIDLFQIQKQLGIYLIRERDLIFIKLKGCEDALNNLLNQQKISKTEIEQTMPPPKFIKPFPKYLVHDKPDDLAAVCKTVFNQNESPKDYAIMLCLLSQLGFISIQDKFRKEFYESWYAFINIPLPKRSNFFSINKHIDEKTANGFHFNEDDIDFLHLNENFSKALQNNNLLPGKVV